MSPLTRSTVLSVMFVPVTATENDGPPELTVVGVIDVIVGAGGPTVTSNAVPFDTQKPPAQAGGFTTVIECVVPTVVTSLNSTRTVMTPSETKPLERGLPSHCTIEPGTNPLPKTLNARFPKPAGTLVRLSVGIVGVGLMTANV